MSPGVRALAAGAATIVVALAVVLLARVDTQLGSPFGPDRLMRRADSPSTSGAERDADARAVLAQRPLDGRAYRALGLDDIANARWPRDAIARARLAERALAQGDAATGLEHLDALLRIEPTTRANVLSLLMPHLGDARVRDALVDRLALDPPWHADLLAALRLDTTPPDDADALLTALAARTRSTEADLRTRVALLDRAGRPAQARALWLSMLTPAQSADAGLVFDGGFEHPELHDGYGWHFDDLVGVTIDQDTQSPHAGASALAIEFDDRAVQFQGVRQALALAPGRYRLETQVRNAVDSDRPFEWRIKCRDERVVARLSLPRYAGQGDDAWVAHATDFEIPGDCMGQKLVLAHTARSLAERRLRGSLTIDDVGIFLTR